MTKKVIFTDCYKIVQPSEEQKLAWNDAFIDTNTKKGLWVSMEATHAAIGNRNNRFYLPSKMKDGATTFLGRKGKTAPILKHHGGGMFGGDQDPVGKVRGVEYVSTIPENLMDSEEVNLLTDSTIPLKKQIRAASKFLQNDFVYEEDWEGLGYIRLDAEILDPKAIEMVKDNRFDSVSVSFGTNHAFCSICNADWSDDNDGPCEHNPGQIYEDEETGVKERMLLIPGDMNFRECSLVNFDADPHTAITIIDSSMNDSEKQTQVFSDTAVYPIRNMVWEIKDSEGGIPMKKDKTPKAEDIKLDADGNPVEPFKDSKTNSDKINADEIYSEIIKEFKAMVKDGLLTEEEMKDTVLSNEQRAGLTSSTFCGPDQSFPVPDSAHITATKRFLDRYEGTIDKDKILAAITVKEEILGYKEPEVNTSDSESNKELVVEKLTIDKFSDEDLRSTFHKTEAEMVKRGLTVKRECSECATHLKDAEEAKKSKEDAIKDLENSKSTISVLRDELRNEFANYKLLVDESVRIGQDLREAKTRYAAVAAVLAKKSNNLGDATKALGEAEDFDKQFNNFTDSVDLNEIFAKMDNGMVNDNPNTQVKDPTISNDADNDQAPDGLSKTEKAIIERIKEHLEDKDFYQAKSLYDRMITKGILRDSVEWETLLPVKQADK
jgi:hypothetical protein